MQLAITAPMFNKEDHADDLMIEDIRPNGNATPIRFMGIDPQPSMLGIHVLEWPSLKTVEWYNAIFYRKDKTTKAQEWQSYIYTQCKNIIMMEMRKGQQEGCYTLWVAIEQQRGRVNSIIEQTLYCVCRELRVNISIYHATTWRKLTGLTNTGSNKTNKKQVVELISPILSRWCEKTLAAGTKSLMTEDRIHDLCDAYLISYAHLISKSKHKETDPDIYKPWLKEIIQN